mmetsp:Transcript_1608/g.3089  ORF Transcript_1608/g.3089 Transcript_1608/m.3089 type:complete len:100 (-) Transcript_1608:1580-1879(-)
MFPPQLIVSPDLTLSYITCPPHYAVFRWYQAWEAAPDLAPKLYLRATHEKTLDYVPYDVLRMYALDGDEADEERRGLDEQRAKLEALLGKAAEEPQKEE